MLKQSKRRVHPLLKKILDPPPVPRRLFIWQQPACIRLLFLQQRKQGYLLRLPKKTDRSFVLRNLSPVHEVKAARRVPSSYFFLFFEPILIFSYFLTKTSYFSCFLAREAKICNKIENEIIVVLFLSEIYHKASSILTLMF